VGERKSLGQSEWVRNAPIGDAVYMSLWQCTTPIRSPQFTALTKLALDNNFVNFFIQFYINVMNNVYILFGKNFNTSIR